MLASIVPDEQGDLGKRTGGLDGEGGVTLAVSEKRSGNLYLAYCVFLNWEAGERGSRTYAAEPRARSSSVCELTTVMVNILLDSLTTEGCCLSSVLSKLCYS